MNHFWVAQAAGSKQGGSSRCSHCCSPQNQAIRPAQRYFHGKLLLQEVFCLCSGGLNALGQSADSFLRWERAICLPKTQGGGSWGGWRERRTGSHSHKLPQSKEKQQTPGHEKKMGSFKVQASRIQPSHRLAVSSTDPKPWAGWAACKVWCTAKPQPLCLDKKAKRRGRVK